MAPNRLQPAADKRVLFVVMPWAPVIFPAQGAALLRSILNRDEIPCDIYYANLLLSRLLDGDPFIEQGVGELIEAEVAFTPYYFDRSRERAAEFLMESARTVAAEPEALTLDQFQQVIETAGRCLDITMASIPWSEYDIVGFSLMGYQLTACLALARMIKEREPGIQIVFGGPSCSYPMSEEMIRSFPEVDIVVEGEADHIITPLVRQIRAENGDFTVPGVCYRDREGNGCRTGDNTPFEDLESHPIVDYEPYFAQIEAFGLTHFKPYLQIETARGCWWGEKHHCTFCSLEDALMKFRSKSERRVLDEILTLSRRHQYVDFFPTDSILNYRFFKTLIPTLQRLRDEEGYDFTFFFETKSNLRREQVQALHRAGVNRMQPGIESFSDHILGVMRKGTTGIRQLQCLKLLAECDIVAGWNWIYANPGETAHDYREQLEMLPSLFHMPPLHINGLTRMVLLRFSPYFMEPERHGISNVRAKACYQEILPAPHIDRDRLCYYFDYDHPLLEDPEMKALWEQLRNGIRAWRKCYRKDALLQFRSPDTLTIVDRRVWLDAAGEPLPQDERTTVLTGTWAKLFSFCDEIRSIGEVLRRFGDAAPAEEILAFIEQMVALRYLYRSSDGHVLTLPLLKEARFGYGLNSPIQSSRAPAPGSAPAPLVKLPVLV